MARYHCPRLNCTISLKLSDAAVCPVHRHALQLYSKAGVMWVDAFNTDCLAEKENADRLAKKQEKFFSTVFELKSFVPGTARGLFDVLFSPAARQIVITVRVYCNFILGEIVTNGPRDIVDQYARLTPWTEMEKVTWMAEAAVSVGKAWENKFGLCLRKGAWPLLLVRPIFNLDFVTEKEKAHVAADIKKIPPVDPAMFNCGGTFVGLDQIIQRNPHSVSKASLSSESGKTVDVNAQNLGLKVEGVVHYNVIAHEYGHMIGLPDEYENPVYNERGSAADNAKVVHKDGTLKLAGLARIGYADFGKYTDSIMSRGSVVHPHHFITVWEALTLLTKGYMTPDEWVIQ